MNYTDEFPPQVGDRVFAPNGRHKFVKARIKIIISDQEVMINHMGTLYRESIKDLIFIRAKRSWCNVFRSTTNHSTYV